MSVDIDKILSFTIDIAKQCGEKIIAGGQKRMNEQNSGTVDLNEYIKKNTADLVTETDQSIDKFIKQSYKQAYPDWIYIGEEDYENNQREITSDRIFICADPIDGTTNFVKGLPLCCTSIGIIIQGRPAIGVIHAPYLQTTYYAAKGKGAWIDSPAYGGKQKLPFARPLPLPSLRQAVIAIEYGSDRSKKTLDLKQESYKRIAGDPDLGINRGQFVGGIRSFGSAALSGCYVAQGSLDMWAEYGAWAWDVCAAIVLVEESGGIFVGGKQDTLGKLNSADFGQATPQLVQGRKYLVLRAIGDSSNESGREAQKRIIKDYYDTIDEWDVV